MEQAGGASSDSQAEGWQTPLASEEALLGFGVQGGNRMQRVLPEASAKRMVQ